MTPPNDILGQLSRGEPIQVAALLAYISTELGAQLTTGWWDSLLRAAGILGMAITARRYTTPATNPTTPTRTVVLEDGAGAPIIKQIDDRQPVITFRGRRAA